jgi:hypothetical protein
MASTIVLKVNDKIPQEIDLIQEEEGLGNRTSTITFLVKYYFLTKNNSLDSSINMMNRMLDKIDTSKIPSTADQLKNI